MPFKRENTGEGSGDTGGTPTTVEPSPSHRVYFGNGSQTTYSINHPKTEVDSVHIIDVSQTPHRPIGIHTDYTSAAGVVSVGPFSTPPAFNTMLAIITGPE